MESPSTAAAMAWAPRHCPGERVGAGRCDSVHGRRRRECCARRWREAGCAGPRRECSSRSRNRIAVRPRSPARSTRLSLSLCVWLPRPARPFGIARKITSAPSTRATATAEFRRTRTAGRRRAVGLGHGGKQRLAERHHGSHVQRVPLIERQIHLLQIFGQQFDTAIVAIADASEPPSIIRQSGNPAEHGCQRRHTPG